MGGTKIILQRGTFAFTRIHAHNLPLTPRPGNWLGAAEPCYSTHTRTRTGSDSHFLEPGYLPAHQDEFCKPSTGMWHAWRSNFYNIPCILFLSILSTYLSLFSFSFIHMHNLSPSLSFALFFLFFSIFILNSYMFATFSLFYRF